MGILHRQPPPLAVASWTELSCALFACGGDDGGSGDNPDAGAVAYHQISDLIVSNPTVKTLILRQVPGSIDDEVNVQTGRLVRSNGFKTVVPDGGLIASGGVDLFAAGENRELIGTTRVGVHSWSDGENDAADFACNDAAHNMQLCYVGEMLGRENGTNFYFFTIFAASADNIHLMTPAEIAQFSIVTE